MTPAASSAKHRSESTLSGSSVARASASTWGSNSSRLTVMSRRPSVAAKPPLVDASAVKPKAASKRAEPMSYGLGMTKVPLECSERKRSVEVVMTTACQPPVQDVPVQDVSVQHGAKARIGRRPGTEMLDHPCRDRGGEVCGFD